MRKKLLLAVSALLSFTWAQAQVTAAYYATATSGTYDEISDGTLIPIDKSGTELNDAFFTPSGTSFQEAFEGEGFPIGFDFKFNNQLMNQFGVTGHGFITVGKDQVKMQALSDPSFLPFDYAEWENIIGVAPRIMFGATDATTISYKVVGEAPNRVLVVQYKDFQIVKETWSGSDLLSEDADFQIRLSENGDIKLVFNRFNTNDSYSSNYQDGWRIGIQGTNGDHLLKSGSFTDNNFSSSSSSISWNSSTKFTDGLTYTFEAPDDCATPAAAATALELTATTTQIDGSFTAATGADRYLVLLSKSGELTTAPEDGKLYAAGDVIGDATVLAFSANTTFTTDYIVDLDGATAYYIHVVSANAQCMFGPKYLTTSVLSGTVNTLPAAPQAITFASVDTTTVVINVTANEQGNDIVLAYTPVIRDNGYNQFMTDGQFGTPTGEVAVGDELENGGTIIYVGEAKDGITVDNLPAGKNAFFAAWSKDAQGQYSSTDLRAATKTAATLPWSPDLSVEPFAETPIGWDDPDDLYTQQIERATGEGYLQCNGLNGGGEDNTLSTSYVYLSEGINRFMVNAQIYVWGRFGNSPWDLTENDKIVLSVSEDGETWEEAYTWAGADLNVFLDDPNAYHKLIATFTAGAGKKVKLRLNVISQTSPYCLLKDFRVEEKLACDYPINVTTVAGSVVADLAQITWTSQGEEDAWEISVKKSDEETWGEPVVVREKPYQLSGLDGKTSYDVRVRARCSAESKSPWSDVYTFISGQVAPFTEDFSQNAGWQMKQGAIGTELTESNNYGWSYSAPTSGWFSRPGNINYYGEADENNTVNDWAISAPIAFGDGTYNFTGTFTLIYNAAAENENTDETLQVLVARDGEDFTADDVVLTITKADLPELYEQKDYQFTIKGISGNARVAFLVHTTSGTPAEYAITSIDYTYSCYNDAVATVSDIDYTSATVKWEGTADKWLVFTREAGNEERVFTETTDNVLNLTGLKLHTLYEVGITKSCGEGDTAKVVIAEFLTLGEDCPEVTDVAVSAEKYAATISWSSEASGFNVVYRKKGADSWTKETVTEPTITLIGLEDNTAYEYAIQAMCSRMEGDTSAYTATAEFTTLVQNCLAPTDIQIAATYKQAEVTWTGEAASYRLGYRAAATEEWTVVDVEGNAYTIEGLKAETAYKVRLQSVCGEGDESLWSNVVDFTTKELPECVTPTDLAAEIGETSVKLSWKGDDYSNIAWNLRYRSATVGQWTIADSLNTTTYEMTDVETNAAYIWQVMAVCDEGRLSKWTAQQRFTFVPSGIDKVGIGELTVFAQGRAINIVNPEGGLVKSVQVYDLNGRLIGAYELNTTDNVFIPVAAQRGNLIVKVNGQKTSKTTRVTVK